MVSPSYRRAFGFQWDRVEAELEVRKDRIMVTPRATPVGGRQHKNSSTTHDIGGGKNVIEQCKFNSRVPTFAAGEKAFAERSCRASMKQSVCKPQVQPPILELLDRGSQQVLGGRKVVSGDYV